MRRVGVIFGTRPEVIKLAPLVRALELHTPDLMEGCKPILVSSGQHREMLQSALAVTKLRVDYELNLMSENQGSAEFLARAIEQLSSVVGREKLSAVVVQGDTSTALAGALAAFHHRIPIVHLEAGLRSFDLSQPFPEEMNRVCISRIAALHLCPTERAAKNLRSEGIHANVHVVGNTVVDAVLWASKELESGALKPQHEILTLSEGNFIFVTAHRRENFDGSLESLCLALLKVLDEEKELKVIFPVHLNPQVQTQVRKVLGSSSRVHLLPPLDYATALELIRRASLIVTDSGGIQEEAPAFSKRILVARKVTERPEVIESGFGEFLDLTTPESAAKQILLELRSTTGPVRGANPFGDGTAAAKSAELVWRLISAGARPE